MSALALREPLNLTGVVESLAISVRVHSGSLGTLKGDVTHCWMSFETRLDFEHRIHVPACVDISDVPLSPMAL